jgi:hypothetical protein
MFYDQYTFSLILGSVILRWVILRLVILGSVILRSIVEAAGELRDGTGEREVGGIAVLLVQFEIFRGRPLIPGLLADKRTRGRAGGGQFTHLQPVNKERGAHALTIYPSSAVNKETDLMEELASPSATSKQRY